MATSPTSQQSAHGEYLLSKGWIPQGLGEGNQEIWQEPDNGRKPVEKEVKVHNLKKPDSPSTFKRLVKPTVPWRYTTMQAVYRQRQMDAKVA